MKFATYTSPHGPMPNTVTWQMSQVLIALVPGIIALAWYFGYGVLINISIATTAAVLGEALVMKLRKRDIRATLADLSSIVTAVLLGMALPPLLPWWMTVIGTLFAIILVKHMYGGLGYNPFNPAMAGYVLLLISFPVSMTQWLAPNMLTEYSLTFSETLKCIFTSELPAGLNWDAVTSATPLDEMRNQLNQAKMISEIKSNQLWGDYGARGWEWVANWLLLGGLFLLWRKVITWHIPISMIGGMLTIAGLFWLLDPETVPFPAFHLFSGGLMLGAFFIATDPVTACTTRKGQLIYGAMIGVLVFIIRTWGGYPDVIAFAVLLMNMAAPTIDYYTRPRVYGQREDNG